MKNAIVAALVAALVGAGAGSAATTLINGHSIRPHSIPLNRLAKVPPAGIRATKIIDGANVTIAGNASGAAQADCPNGWLLLGGGGYTSSGVLFESDVASNGQSWEIQVDNSGFASVATANAEAICGKP